MSGLSTAAPSTMGRIVPKSKPKLPGGTRWNATPRADSVAFGPAHAAVSVAPRRPGR